jgi:chaperonin cofactor prefoldin
MATNKFYLPNVEETAEEYTIRMAKVYKKMQKAQKQAEKLANKIADLREKGFKIIILGRTVRVTI